MDGFRSLQNGGIQGDRNGDVLGAEPINQAPEVSKKLRPLVDCIGSFEAACLASGTPYSQNLDRVLSSIGL